MPKYGVTKLNVAIDRLLEVTENPRHRFMLQAYSRHHYLEVPGRYEEIFPPEMMNMNPLFVFRFGGNNATLTGQDNVKSLNRFQAETNQSIFFTESEEVAVSDHNIFSAVVVYQQISGAVFKANKLLAHLPHVGSEKIIGKLLPEKGPQSQREGHVSLPNN